MANCELLGALDQVRDALLRGSPSLEMCNCPCKIACANPVAKKDVYLAQPGLSYSLEIL